MTRPKLLALLAIGIALPAENVRLGDSSEKSWMIGAPALTPTAAGPPSSARLACRSACN